MENNKMKIQIVSIPSGFEVYVLKNGAFFTGERHGSFENAVCAAKFLSVQYSAPIKNLNQL
tara:strand:- start:38 stop:220 length:183 start_codon:yes stop_codon:yes gene_type:complete